jgi:phosphatidylserine/phosphatidylglycerophosphate/cardiolipin synthase-like enzyme
MRFKSPETDGFQVFAVAGVNTISFAITATEGAKQNLLGFAVERARNGEKPEFRPGFKVFRSLVPHPTKEARVSTKDHPVQSFVWDDFTAQPDCEYEYLFHPTRGTPGRLNRSAEPLSIRVRTEPLFSEEEHDVFFNRGVASCQAYAARFNNKKPDQLPAKKKAEALRWLSRDLNDALLRFIQSADRGDTLLCCFYEFRYNPVIEALKSAVEERDVDVRVIIDAKLNGRTDKKTGKPIPPFPRNENLTAIKTVGFPADRVILRVARKNKIHHNKFMVLLKGRKKKPMDVWTGSTNISEGGIFGQTNVGHWVRSANLASRFMAYWELLSTDPGSTSGDSRKTAMQKNKSFLRDVEKIQGLPASIKAIPPGVSPVFSPRTALKILDMYFDLVASAKTVGCITLAFGVANGLKSKLRNNTPDSPIVFMLLEKEDRPPRNSKINPGTEGKTMKPFIRLTAANNVYEAFGAFIKDPLYQWTRETNTQRLKLNQHVAYIHSKFLLMDPLGDDPIVVTGSANFSEGSTNGNDENMLIIRGDHRVADIYFTEFNRLFNHYYFRAVHEKASSGSPNSEESSLFLAENPAEWLDKYRPGSLRFKRVQMFAKMRGISSA